MQPLGFILLLAFGGLIFLLALVFAVMWGLSHPPRRTYASAVAKNLPGAPDELEPSIPFEQWSLESAGLSLPVWDMRGRDPDGPTIVFSHGWGDSRLGALPRAQRLADFASRLIAWDLPAHGKAKGTCRLGLHESIHLSALLDALEGPLVLYGWSLGAGLAIQAGTHPKVVAVIAEAPFRFQHTPARNVLRQAHLPSGLTLSIALFLLGMRPGRRRAFDRAGLASRLSCPLLIIHGSHDEICPIEDSRAIAQAAANATLVEIAGGNHNGLWIEPDWAEQCTRAVAKFLQSSLASAH